MINFSTVTVFLLSLVAYCAPDGMARQLADDEVQSRQGSAVGDVSYEADIRPLLQAKCVSCHGEKTRKADLNLTTAAAAARGGESGPGIVPGDPDKSLLYEKIYVGEMPPDDTDRLSDAEIKLVERWIRNGAVNDGDQAMEPASSTPNQHDVVPIMLRRCAACHGRHQQLAGLDLRSRTAMMQGGKSGPAIVPGKPEESLLIKKVHAGEMPPLERLVEVSVKPIEPAEVETLVKWIAAGAPEIDAEPDVATTQDDPLVSDEDRDFWAFRSPPSVTVPEVQNPQRVRNAIDAFIIQKLAASGLAFNAEADRLTLIRRATVSDGDVTGWIWLVTLTRKENANRIYLGLTPGDSATTSFDPSMLTNPSLAFCWNKLLVMNCRITKTLPRLRRRFTITS